MNFFHDEIIPSKVKFRSLTFHVVQMNRKKNYRKSSQANCVPSKIMEILCFVSLLCKETNSSFSGNHKMKLTSGQNDSLCIQRQVNKQ